MHESTYRDIAQASMHRIYDYCGYYLSERNKRIISIKHRYMFETNLRILLRTIFVNARFNRLLKCITIF